MRLKNFPCDHVHDAAIDAQAACGEERRLQRHSLQMQPRVLLCLRQANICMRMLVPHDKVLWNSRSRFMVTIDLLSHLHRSVPKSVAVQAFLHALVALSLLQAQLPFCSRAISKYRQNAHIQGRHWHIMNFWHHGRCQLYQYVQLCADQSLLRSRCHRVASAVPLITCCVAADHSASGQSWAALCCAASVARV